MLIYEKPLFFSLQLAAKIHKIHKMKIWLLLLSNALLATPCLPSMRQGHFLKTSNFYGAVDFLWWEGTERGLEFASTYEPAFRFSLGYHLPKDDWNVEFAYTRFYTHTTDAASAWKLHTNFFELFLKHPFFLSTEVAVEPALSVKCALLQQRYQMDYSAMKNRSFNLGPAASLLSRWYFADHLNLFANLSGALFASHFQVERNELDTLQENNSFWALRPQAGASLGVSFSDAFCRPKQVFYYALSASYETQIYWKQNMFYRFIDPTATKAPTQGTLFFHGLTLTAMVDF